MSGDEDDFSDGSRGGMFDVWTVFASRADGFESSMASE